MVRLSPVRKESEIKHIILAIPLLIIVLLIACTIPPNTPTQMTASSTATVSLIAPTILTIAPTQTTASDAAEEAQIRDLVENFGKRLQAVSLQSPNAAQEMQEQYSEFVSPTLLEMWMRDVSKAPGRIVSSPWPDRIDITTLAKQGSERYMITGFVVEITSVEVVSGGAAAKIPVRIVAQRVQGHWLITEYAAEQ
jgi:hypothetical protein